MCLSLFHSSQLDRVAPGIHNLEDLNAILRRHAKNPDFANLIQHTQSSKVPVDISIEGFPMLLRTAFEGFAFTFGRKLFLRKGTKGKRLAVVPLLGLCARGKIGEKGGCGMTHFI